MMKKWVYPFDELDEVEAYAGGGWDGVKEVMIPLTSHVNELNVCGGK